MNKSNHLDILPRKQIGGEYGCMYWPFNIIPSGILITVYLSTYIESLTGFWFNKYRWMKILVITVFIYFLEVMATKTNPINPL